MIARAASLEGVDPGQTEEPIVRAEAIVRPVSGGLRG